jgi:hypothetical protein
MSQYKYPPGNDLWRVIWLSPVCEHCVKDAEVTWCQDNIYDPCEDCGKKSTRYVIETEPTVGHVDEAQ